MPALDRLEEDAPPSSDRSPGSPPRRAAALPPEVEAAVWRGTDLETPCTAATLPSGFAALDRELPGGGWPRRSLTELLQAQPSVLEWRLLGPGLRQVSARQQTIVLIGPPKIPHLPGLRHAGIEQPHVVCVEAQTPAERLWCTEQLVKSNALGAIVAWLPQCRPEHLRRLQVAAQGCEAPVFVFRPAQAQFEPSPAPLRLLASAGPAWELQVRILKRRGPLHGGTIRLRSVPGGLAAVLPPRLQQAGRFDPLPRQANDDAALLGRSATRGQRQHAAH